MSSREEGLHSARVYTGRSWCREIEDSPDSHSQSGVCYDGKTYHFIAMTLQRREAICTDNQST